MPTFTYVGDMAVADMLVKPLLVGYLTSDAAYEMTIRTERPRERAPDGWFHASSHPSLEVPELVAYLRAPREVPKEMPRDYVMMMATTIGTIMHEVSRQALEKKLKLAIPPPRGECLACHRPRPGKCREHAVTDAALGARGHLDGILNFTEVPTRDIPRDPGVIEPGLLARLHGYDFKTAMTMTLKDVPEMNEAAFKAKWPRYWWQAQEYMRMTGLRQYIVLVMGIGTPWTMKEFHIRYSAAAAADIERRYGIAREQTGIAA